MEQGYTTPAQHYGDGWLKTTTNVNNGSQLPLGAPISARCQVDVCSSGKCCKARSVFNHCVTKKYLFQRIYIILNALSPGFKRIEATHVPKCIYFFFMHKQQKYLICFFPSITPLPSASCMVVHLLPPSRASKRTLTALAPLPAPRWHRF